MDRKDIVSMIKITLGRCGSDHNPLIFDFKVDFASLKCNDTRTRFYFEDFFFCDRDQVGKMWV